MSATPDFISPQKSTEITQCWKGVHFVSTDGVKPGKVQNADASSSSDELNTKVRKPYTITKQRERWTDTEHQKFLEALKLYGRAWRRIEEYIGTKTAVQIRSHAQKFFSKLEREASTGSSGGKLPDIAIPPPRPKRKPSHPYPRKGGSSLRLLEDERKDAMFSSPACRSAAHSEAFQMGFFSPCTSQGLSAGCVAENSAAHGQLFDRQGGVNLFGKTVSIPKGDKGVLGGIASSDGLVRHDDDVPAKQSSAEPSEIMGFSSFVEIRNKIDSFPQTAIQSDRNVSQAETTQPGGTGESFRGACDYDRPGTDIEAGDSVNCIDRGCKVSDDWEQGNSESGLLAADLKEGEKGRVQLSHIMNPAVLNWMNNVPQWQNGNLIPPISTSGSVDIASGNPSSYWQFIQASAMNYAAYTAAMAVVAVAGWKPTNSGGADSTTLNECQLPALLSLPWWPYGRFIPPVFLHPPNTVQQGEVLHTFKAAADLGDVKGGSVASRLQGEEPDAGLKVAEIADTCNAPLITGYETNLDHPIINSPTQMCSTLERSCLTQASVKIVPESDLHLYAAAMPMPVKASNQSSDTEVRDTFMSPQNSYSSPDELEDPGKKRREGSSSGSNTPASRYRSSECGAPKIKESNNSYTPSKDKDDGWSDNILISHQQCVANTAELLNQRVKHAEKGRKHQQRDARHGGGGDSKRFKSFTHEIEIRKEVSQEGRKAFQALFASKLLPQTFKSAEERELMAKDECVSRPTVSRDEAKVTGYGRIRLNGDSGEKLSKEIDCTNDSGTLKLCNHSQRFDVQARLAISKGFAVSSSSGFVPYRKLCLEPLKVAQP